MKVLMTDGTSSSARQTLYGVSCDWEVDVCAPSPIAQCRFSSYVRHFHRCPPIGLDPVGYWQFLLRRLRSDRYDVILPTHEEVYLLSRFRDALSEHTAVAVPPLPAMRQMMGKVEFAQAMQGLGLPVPRFAVLKTLRDWESYDGFPYFLKLNYATAGQGVRLIRHPADRKQAIDEFRRLGVLDGERMLALAQEPSEGKICVAQGVFQHGRLIASHCAEALETGIGGGAMRRVSVRRPKVLQHLQTLGQSLAWHGAMFLEYFHDPGTDQVCYIECNPRIGEPVNALLSGVKLVEALVDVALDRASDSYGESEPGIVSHLGFVSLIARAMGGATRGELWRNAQQMARRTGPYRDAENEMTRPSVDRLSLIPAAFVTTQLLARPASARQIVDSTVYNYALPATAIHTIDQMVDPVVGPGLAYSDQ